MERLGRIIELLQECVHYLKSIDRKIPNHYTIRVKEKNIMALGIVVGGSAGFKAELLKNGVPIDLPATSTWAWSSADPLVSFAPAPADPTTGVVDPNDIEVTVAGSDTQTSAVITASTTDPDGNPENGDITVPVTPEAAVFTVRITEL